jgi:hypothetical protein
VVDCEHAIWETFMSTQQRLANNRSQFARRAQGAPRPGAALLAVSIFTSFCQGRIHVYLPGVGLLDVGCSPAMATDERLR